MHLSPLSVTDCWVLQEAGYEPVGVAAATVVYCARPGVATSQVLGNSRRSAPLHQELPDLSEAATSARDLCQARMAEQAKRQGGTGIIGMSLDLSHGFGAGLRGEGAGSRSPRYANLHLVVHGLGSAIRPLQAADARQGHAGRPRAMLWLS